MAKDKEGSAVPRILSGMRQQSQFEREAVVSAVLVTTVLHLIMFLVLPESGREASGPADAPSESFEILLEDPEPSEEIQERYVRAAPNVAEEVPEETFNISDRDQKAAQPEEADELSPDNSPMVEGDLEESNRIVQGDPRSQPVAVVAAPSGSPGGASPMPRQESMPFNPILRVNRDFSVSDERIQNEQLTAMQEQTVDSEGLIALEEPDLQVEEPVRPEVVQPAEDAPIYEAISLTDGQGQDPMTSPEQVQGDAQPRPRPRVQVQQDNSYGPIKDNPEGVIFVGRLAFDAQYSEFGEYWKRVAEVIEARWRNLVYNTRSVQLGGYRVTVQFAINRDGDVLNLEVVNSTADRLSETISKDAIESEAPFYEWTPEMILKMGNELTCRITFFY